VKKGAHGTPIVKVGRTRYSTDEDDGGETIHRGTFLKYYTVFNLEQLDGIDAPVQDVEPTPNFTPIERCDKLVAAIPNPPENHAGAAAYYTPALDRVTMPPQTWFSQPERYYSTLYHELTHSTGHPSRLHRDTLKDACRFGSTNYSKEELVAEMGAAFLCGIC